MDETRIERALREGPPFRTHYVGQPLPLSSQAAGTHLAPLRQDRRGISTALIVVTLLLTLIIGGAALVGSGILKLPVLVDASASPSATADASADASATPVEQVPASWTATGSMILDRGGYTATLLSDGTVLVTGGMGPVVTGGPEELFPWASAELYHPSSGTWTATGSMIEGREGYTAALLLDGRVLVTGFNSYDPAGTWNGRSPELYDPISGTWTATGRMVEAGFWRTATLLLDGRVLVTGGGDGGPSGSAELYDPDTGTWTVTGSMVEARTDYTATLLADGTVLVAGGGSASGSFVASAELYHPSSGTWTATVTMVEGRNHHTATLLPDGTVLVVGGNSNSYSDIGLLTSAELYDPSSGSWTATVTMVEGRNHHTATLLSDGTVLVVGGRGDRSALLTSAELYDPGSGN